MKVIKLSLPNVVCIFHSESKGFVIFSFLMKQFRKKPLLLSSKTHAKKNCSLVLAFVSVLCQ